jgi:hypothetical protein
MERSFPIESISRPSARGMVSLSRYPKITSPDREQFHGLESFDRHSGAFRQTRVNGPSLLDFILKRVLTVIQPYDSHQASIGGLHECERRPSQF